MTALVLLFAFAMNAAYAAPNPLDSAMQSFADNGFSGSLIVSIGSDILYDSGVGLADTDTERPITAETVFDIGSLTKQFTAAAIVRLASMGLVSFSDSLPKFFADVPADKRGITVHHLLTHFSGLDDIFGDDYDLVSRAEFLKVAFNSKLVLPVGDSYRYSNAGYSILAAIVELTSAQPYEQFLREQFFLPAGMLRTGYRLPQFRLDELAVGYDRFLWFFSQRWGTPLDHSWRDDSPSWHLLGNGGILSTAADMHRWLAVLKTDSIVTAAEKELLFTPYVKIPESSASYSYGWVVVTTSRNTRLLTHTGGNGIFSAIMRWWVEEDIQMIMLGNQAKHSVSDYAPRVSSVILEQVEAN